jgi:hypothetical protein
LTGTAQENIYGEGLKFTSMKKIVRDLGADYDDFELASFHSTSKGLIGECGRRGGYMELCGFDAVSLHLGDATSSLGDAKSSLGDAKSSLGDAESSLGDAKSSMDDAKSSLGDAESSLGDAKMFAG